MAGAHAAMDLSIRESGESAQTRTLNRHRAPPATPLTRTGILRLTTALRALARGRKSSTEYHMEVARVFREFYGAKLEALRSGEGPSFSDLARDLRGTIKRTTLHRALWAYEVRETTPVYKMLAAAAAAGPVVVPALERVAIRSDQRERLKVMHYYAVRAFDTDRRSELLSLALHHGWSARRLEIYVAGFTEKNLRPPLPVIFKLFQRTHELRPKEIDVTPLGRLGDDQVEVYRAMVSEVEALVIRAKAALAERHAAARGTGRRVERRPERRYGA